jgi:hypothetical protein
MYPNIAALIPLEDVIKEVADVLDTATESIKRIHARHFQGYMGEKRKNLVMKYKYDTKNAAHLIRLMRMCIDFLRTGVMTVYRTEDAQYIKDIKAGKYELDYVKREAGVLFAIAKDQRMSSPLPATVDIEAIDALTVSTYFNIYERSR